MKEQLIFGLLLLGAHFGLSFPNEHQRIINGSYAAAKQFPFQVFYDVLDLTDLTEDGIEWKPICGGTLISRRIILTAAHCLQSPTIYAFKIYFGAVDTSNEDEIGQQRLMVKRANAVIHQEYEHEEARPGKPLKVYNDIALIKLPVDVAFDEYIRPAKLPEPEISYSSKGIISGWGAVEVSVDGQLVYDPKLRYTHGKILSHYECKKRIRSPFFVSSQICLAPSKNSPCKGDSGGPLAVTQKGDTVVLGIMSYGINTTCTDEYPAVYTRVASYLNWIRENAGAHNLEE